MLKMVKIDRKDKKILAALDMDARMPMTQLAKKVGLSRQVVEYRIKRMQKENIIFGALAIFDSVVVGYNWYRVTFRFLKINKEEKNKLINHLKKHKHISWLGEAGGNWDMVMNVVCKDNFAFNGIFEELIGLYGSSIRDYEILIYLSIHDLQRTYILSRKERTSFFHEMKHDSKIKLDKLDFSIIKTLSKDALKSNVDLAHQLNVTANTIKNRIDNLKKNKVLLGFRLFINPTALGYKSHMLFLEITRLDLKKEKELYSYLQTILQITFIVKHIGRWRFGMEIETKDEQEFQDIFVAIRARFSEIITDFESFPIFKDHTINYFPEGCLE